MSRQAAIWKLLFLPKTAPVMAMKNLRHTMARIHRQKSGLNWK